MKEEEKKFQEKYMEMKELEEQMKHIQQQSNIVEQQLMELMSNVQCLDDLKKIKEGTEILVPVTSGVFAKAALKENKKLLVNVGADTVISKDIDSTKKLMEKQVGEMRELQAKMMMQMQRLALLASHTQEELKELASKLE